MTDADPVRQHQLDKRETIRDVEFAINTALLVWEDDDPVVRRILLACRGDLREHLEGARS